MVTDTRVEYLPYRSKRPIKVEILAHVCTECGFVGLMVDPQVVKNVLRD